jgi:hypothetical protein
VLKFKATHAEIRQIIKVCERTDRLLDEMHRGQGYRSIDYRRQDQMMDLEAVHSNGCPLDFDKLLSFDDGNFAHDVLGIRQHIDRETGQLAGYFMPRCAMT